MKHSAKVICDSISPRHHRLTTFEVTFPRPILAEVNTHRILSKSSASSRAVPVRKMIDMVKNHPFIPVHWGKNQKGMQAEEELSGEAKAAARANHLRGRDLAVEIAEKALEIGLHKQRANRYLEPYAWHTAIITGTSWSNFFHLRFDKEADPEFILTAALMLRAMNASTPTPRNYDEWHLPYVLDSERHLLREDVLQQISVARCARVSYLNHDGDTNVEKDFELYRKLITSGHMGPFEHVARPLNSREERAFLNEGGRNWQGAPYNTGNFVGWMQHRKLVPMEFDVKHERGWGQMEAEMAELVAQLEAS